MKGRHTIEYHLASKQSGNCIFLETKERLVMKKHFTNPTSQKTNFLDVVRYLLKNGAVFRAMRKIEKARFTMMLANIELAKSNYADPLYARRLNEFNQAMLELIKGKWYAAQAMDTHSRTDWNSASQSLRKAQTMGQELERLLRAGDNTPVDHRTVALTSDGSEITFTDGIPIVPEINPVVILQGSDFEMGYQYAQQVIQIFGPWLMRRKAGRVFTSDESNYIRQWEEQIRQFAPEILDMCRGWAAGATEAGVLMSYDDVLEIWTGHEPPAEDYMGVQPGKPRELPRPACSGVAVWGRATVDGKLVAGASGDHDCTYMVTIVAFPQSGNTFVYTPFSAIGDVPEVGQVFMMGHPGMNNKGLAYIEHGGEMRMIEPKNDWGYGIRKGTSALHVLRFANSAKEALEMELSFPVGDVGRAMGSAGGFYADSTKGYVLESRRNPIIVREPGVMGETDFLYANNSAMHPEAGKAGWMQPDKENWGWDAHGGWYPTRFTEFSLLNAFRMKPTDRTLMALGNMYKNSCGRGRYAYGMLNQAIGKIDLDLIKKMYSQSGSFPPGTLKEIRERFNKTGEWGQYSIGHATNALVAIMKPDNGSEGVYSLCVGTAARGLTPNSPTRATPIYGETNAFWEISLADSPKGVTAAARTRAQEIIQQAGSYISRLTKTDTAFAPLTELLILAHSELNQGIAQEDAAKKATGNEGLYKYASATRSYTRAQVRALQVCQALVPVS
ncbi:MAG: hypothetical protein MUO40_09660 [Anaerolineaceae bacterium]|nr:hypothetical protein [Anaerolineaceae bacterium]